MHRYDSIEEGEPLFSAQTAPAKQKGYGWKVAVAAIGVTQLVSVLVTLNVKLTRFRGRGAQVILALLVQLLQRSPAGIAPVQTLSAPAAAVSEATADSVQLKLLEQDLAQLRSSVAMALASSAPAKSDATPDASGDRARVNAEEMPALASQAVINYPHKLALPYVTPRQDQMRRG